MDVEYSLNQVLQVLRKSGLHFSAQETPYSQFISIRKKFRQDIEITSYFAPHLSSNTEEKICDLKKQCEKLENVLEGVRSDLQQEIDDHEKTVKEKAKLIDELTAKEKLIDNLNK